MSKFKRTLAMLIAVVMVICALPMTVAAEGTKDFPEFPAPGAIKLEKRRKAPMCRMNFSSL